VHGFFKGICKQCEEEYIKACRGRAKLGANFNSYDWIKKGEWEHIDPNLPNMKFNSKEDLKRECEKRGLLVKAFMKPVSRGNGFEHSKR